MTASTRAMYGLAGAVIGLAYALRAVGDVGTPWLTWLSPIGWYQAMHAFSGLRWWPLLLLVAGAALAVARGVRRVRTPRLRRRACSPTGPARSGRPAAARLRSGSPGGCSAAPVHRLDGRAAPVGALYGSIGDDVGDLMGDSELSRDMFARQGTARRRRVLRGARS